MKKLTTQEFINKSKKIHGEKYDYSNVYYLNNKSKVEIICHKHGKFEQRPDHHLKGIQCYYCGKEIVGLKQTYSLQEFIDKCSIVHKNKYSYDGIENYKNTSDMIIIKCPKHGLFKQNANRHMEGHGCSICYDSKGELKIKSFLEMNNIKFYKQYKFENCLNSKTKRKLPFDFYLPEQNVCIEYDGLQHFKPITRYGGEDGFNKIKNRDKIKNNFCLKNDINLHRIKFNDDIEQFLKNILNLM